MLKSQKNKVYELFFATYNELYNMDKIERGELLKDLTEKESQSHYYNSEIDSKTNYELVCLTIANVLDKVASDDLIEEIMQSCMSPRLGILVDFNKQSVSIISTRSKSIKTDNFAIFNFDDDFDNPGLFMEMSSFDQVEGNQNDQNFVNELISKIMFIKDLEDSNNKIKVLKNFSKLLKKDSLRIIESYNVLATMLIVYAKRTSVSCFDKDYEKFYNQSTMIVFDALSFYSKEINNFQDDNLSFFNKIWLYNEQSKLKHFGYLSKNKKFFPFVKKQGFNFIF